LGSCIAIASRGQDIPPSSEIETTTCAPSRPGGISAAGASSRPDARGRSPCEISSCDVGIGMTDGSDQRWPPSVEVQNTASVTRSSPNLVPGWS